MVENIFFLDSEHVEMRGNAPPKKDLLFLLSVGKTIIKFHHLLKFDFYQKQV